ncbi:hypothetical protein Tco_1076732 [Tanacetum coccineum]
MNANITNWSSPAYQEFQKIIKDEIAHIINQVEVRVKNFKNHFVKEAAKFVREFKSLAKGVDEVRMGVKGQVIIDPVMQCTTFLATQASLKRCLFHSSRSITRFYQLSHSEIEDIEKVAVHSSLRSPNNKSALIESRANEIN